MSSPVSFEPSREVSDSRCVCRPAEYKPTRMCESGSYWHNRNSTNKRVQCGVLWDSGVRVGRGRGTWYVYTQGVAGEARGAIRLKRKEQLAKLATVSNLLLSSDNVVIYRAPA